MANTEHEQKPVTFHRLVSFWADEKIVPLLHWMNEMPGIETHFSCQGTESTIDENGNNSQNMPYIMFTCNSMGSLNCISTILSLFGKQEDITLEISYHYLWEPTRIVMRFKDVATIMEFMEYALNIDTTNLGVVPVDYSIFAQGIARKIVKKTKKKKTKKKKTKKKAVKKKTKKKAKKKKP
tara:strand:- start:647 stop:1189 length:543 start_codon:yes stop_codon:yes gene_type:complete